MIGRTLTVADERIWGLEVPETAADEIDSPRDNRRLRLGAGLFAALFLLAAFAPMEASVIGGGQIGVETQVKRIAHPIGGVIAAINVANGEHVVPGEVLMRLDSNVSGTEALNAGLNLEQLLAQKARLEVERVGGGRVFFPAELTTSKSPSATAAMRDEARLFQVHIAESTAMDAQLSSRIAQNNEQIVGLEAQQVSIRKQITLIEPELAAMRSLWDRKLVTINRLNQAERTAADLDGTSAQIEARIAEVRARTSEARSQQLQAVAARRAKAGDELAQTNAALNQQRVRATAATDQQARTTIRAPYSGTVEKLAFAAIGEVIKPAETIMEIVPDRDNMVVEAMLSPADIDQVRSGQPARVRFTAFNQASTPEIMGTVTQVATDRTNSPDGQRSYYTARIEIDKNAIRAEGMALRAGMPAEVFIRTGSRSLLSFVFKPLRDQFARAFRGD